MEKLEKLEKVKILQNGQEIDAYLNIAENVHSRIFGKTFDDVTLTIFGEFLDGDKNPIYYKQIVTEHDGIRDVFKIPKLLNKKIVTTIDVSDQFIKIPKKLGFIISKDIIKMQKQIKEIILDNKFKYQKLDMKQMNSEKMKMLEEIFDEVV